MDKATLINKIGAMALDNYLSDWNHNRSYEEIITKLENIKNWSDTKDVEAWDKFENSTPSYVADKISTLFDETVDLIKTTLEAVDSTTKVSELLEILKTL
jgi:hypothetical protein